MINKIYELLETKANKKNTHKYEEKYVNDSKENMRYTQLNCCFMDIVKITAC